MLGASLAVTTPSTSTSQNSAILRLVRLGDVAVGAQHDRVGLDADAAQRGDRVLRRLGLQLARRADVRHQRDVQEEAVVAAEVVAHLTGSLEERLRLDVADRAADLGDDDVDVVVRLRAHAGLDLVGDVRDDLHGVPEVLAATLLRDDLRVDLAGRHVRRTDEVDVEEPLVVPDVEVRLGTVLGDEDLAVLERVHGARVHVEVRVELLHRDPQATGAKESAEAARRQTLTEGGGDTPGDEDVPGRGFRPPGESMRALCHGIPNYPTNAGSRGHGTGESGHVEVTTGVALGFAGSVTRGTRPEAMPPGCGSRAAARDRPPGRPRPRATAAITAPPAAAPMAVRIPCPARSVTDTTTQRPATAPTPAPTTSTTTGPDQARRRRAAGRARRRTTATMPPDEHAERARLRECEQRRGGVVARRCAHCREHRRRDRDEPQPATFAAMADRPRSSA